MDHASALNGAVVFQTARLVCRRWLPGDADAIFTVYADPTGARWVDDGQPIAREDCDRWLNVTANNYVTRGYGMFALMSRDSTRVLGFCGLVHPGGQAEAEIKYALRSSYWGRGLATEAIAGLLGYGQEHHRLAKVIATVAAENHASRRALLKSQFRLTRETLEDDGVIVCCYEWRAQ
ncbi:MAG: GNAT family N-acetyltransferase [Pseudomonadales bacterium]